MNEPTGKGEFLHTESKVADFMAYPRFLTELELCETAKLIYVLLLDRARLSIKNKGWSDESGNVFIYYSLKELAAVSGKSITTVKTALQDLQQADLIFRERRTARMSRRIYVKIRSENCPPNGQKTDHSMVGKLTISKYNRIKEINKYDCGEDESL